MQTILKIFETAPNYELAFRAMSDKYMKFTWLTYYNIIDKLDNKIIIIDDFPNLSDNNINNKNDNMNKILENKNNKILFLSKKKTQNKWEPRESAIIEDLAAESLFVDIGANIGWHTLVFFF